MKGNQMFRFGCVMALLGALGAGRSLQAESWKPALRDADRLQDAASDLYARAERLADPRVIPVTASLKHFTKQLYQTLKEHGCSADVVPLLNTTGSLLSETSDLVTLSPKMRGDRKSISELTDAGRYFRATSDHVVHLVHHQLEAAGVPHVDALHYGPYSAAGRNSKEHAARWQDAFGAANASSGGYPGRGPYYDHPAFEQRAYPAATDSPGKALARVLISELLAR